MNVFAYRLPGKITPSIIEGGTPFESLPPSDGREYFLLHPFLPNDGLKVYPVVGTLDAIPSDIIKDNPGSPYFPVLSKKQYKEYIDDIQREIKRQYVMKVVASRRKVIDLKIEPHKAFMDLCNAYPNAFVFFISTPEFGNWIGASPELLLERQNDHLYTMALAGTRPRGTGGEWDHKNIIEQKVVTSFIKKVFFMNDFHYITGDTVTLEAGPVEHIVTPLKATVNPTSRLNDLLRQISPTPALAGYPPEAAINIITRHEGNSRQLYGGYLGPWNADGNFRLNVILRCARLWSDKALLYAGGGITDLSDPDEEWLETERKLSTLQFIMR